MRTYKQFLEGLNLYGWKEAEEWRQDLRKAYKETLKDKDIKAVLQSDLQREKDFLQDINKSMNIIKNINGIILFKEV